MVTKNSLVLTIVPCLLVLFVSPNAKAGHIWSCLKVHADCSSATGVEARPMPRSGGSPASITAQDELNYALINASAEGDLAKVRALVNAGARVNASVGLSRETVLHVAAIHERVEIVRELLSCGADVHSKEILGRTPLHSAAKLGCIGVIQELVAHGANVNQGDSRKRRPLHLIALQTFTPYELNKGPEWVNQRKHSYRLCLKRLLSLGADLNLLDDIEKSPLHLALSSKYHEMTSDILKSNGYLSEQVLEDSLKIINEVLVHRTEGNVALQAGVAISEKYLAFVENINQRKKAISDSRLRIVANCFSNGAFEIQGNMPLDLIKLMESYLTDAIVFKAQ